MKKKCEILICDRCGKRIELDGLYNNVITDDWLIFRGMDLCPECSEVLDSVLDILFENEKGKNAKNFEELFEAFREALAELHRREIDKHVLEKVSKEIDISVDRFPYPPSISSR